jgi:lysophospholipase L1-like esterase
VPLSLPRKILYSLILPLLPLAVAEGVVRILPRQGNGAPPVMFVGAEFGGDSLVVPDPDFFWKMRPGVATPLPWETINSQGFRGPEVGSKQAQTRRILCLGDSCTYGLDVPIETTFPYRLERWLVGGGAKWEVINRGIPGFSSYQMLQLYEAQKAWIDPDVVLVYAGGWNDYTPAVGLDDYAAAARMRAARDAGPSLTNLALVRNIKKWLRGDASALDFEKRQLLIRNFGQHNENDRPFGPRLKPDQFDQTLSRLAAAARASGATPVFIVPPCPTFTSAKFPDSDGYADIVKKVAARENVATVDARAEMQRSAKNDQEFFFDWIHPNVAGHARIAREIALALQKMKLEGLPALPPRLSDLDTCFPLLSFMDDLSIQQGEPPTAVDVKSAVQLESKSVRLAAPGVARWKNVQIPPQAACYFWLEAGPEAAPPTAAMEIEIRGERNGAKAILYKDTLAPDGKRDWRSFGRRRVELAPVSESTCDFVIEIRGAGWGAAIREIEIGGYR